MPFYSKYCCVLYTSKIFPYFPLLSRQISLKRSFSLFIELSRYYVLLVCISGSLGSWERVTARSARLLKRLPSAAGRLYSAPPPVLTDTVTQALKGKLHGRFHSLPAGSKASVSLFSAPLSRQITLIFHQGESCDDISVATLFADANNLVWKDGSVFFRLQSQRRHPSYSRAYKTSVSYPPVRRKVGGLKTSSHSLLLDLPTQQTRGVRFLQSLLSGERFDQRNTLYDIWCEEQAQL